MEDLFLDVKDRLKKGNKILFSRDSACLQKLINLIETCNHRTLVMWALKSSQQTLKKFEERFPDEVRPKNCLILCESWASGKIKMALAKQAILAAHKAAKEVNDIIYSGLCHAIGHAGATVHVETHGIGLPLYELTSLVREYGNFTLISQKIEFYCENLLYWKENTDKQKKEWAKFLSDDNRLIKEKLLNEKRKVL